MSHVDYVLFEAALGYALFNVVHQADAVGAKLKEVQTAVNELPKFSKMVNLVNFTPFSGHIEALENVNLISEGIVSDQLKSVLELNLPQTSGKKSKITLGVAERNLGSAVKAQFPGLSIETIETSVVVAELIRGIRLHAEKLLKGLQTGDLSKASLGLAHAYSRAKVKFNVTRNDNHIIQAIATVDFQDKGVNGFFMRLREWYGSHFPELQRFASDNYTYAQLVSVIGNKKNLSDEKLHDIAAILGEDGEKAQAIIDAAKVSMGYDLASTDFEIIGQLALLVIKQADNRRSTSTYLDEKLDQVAPNLKALLGSSVAARLISHAGSLTSLAKLPSSTLQILGAEKALFRALKTKGNTPKFGLLFHAGAIAKASKQNKGRMSRCVANKASMASRIDVFSAEPSTRFGDAFKQQVDERLEFYATGKRPTKNSDVIKSVMESLGDAGETFDEDMIDAPDATASKKEKKDKKRKHDEDEDVPMTNAADGEKKKKKKKSKSADE
ncbi:Nop domain-containing protein [Trichoderma chlorosporum]